MTSNPGSGRVWAMLAAPVKLSMLLTLEANCSLLPSQSCVQAGTATQPQTPCWNCPSSCPQGELGSILSSERGKFIIFSEPKLTQCLEGMGWIRCIPSLKAKLWFVSISKCAAPVPWKGGVGAWHLEELSSPADLHHFSLVFFPRNKQGLRPNFLHTYGKSKSKLGMLE